MGKISWARGFFRAWLLLAILWVIGAVAIGSIAIVNAYVPAKVVATLAGADKPEMFPTYGEPASVWAAAVQAGEMKATPIGDGFTLYTRADVTNQRLADRLVEAKRMVNAYIASEMSARRIEYGINTAFWSLVPPLVILILGWAIGWVLSGFRKPA